MRFISGEGRDREEVSILTITRLTGLSNIDIIARAKEVGNNNIIDFGSFKCTVLLNLKPKKKVNRKPRVNGKSKLTLTNIVPMPKGESTPKRGYVLNGKKSSLIEIVELLRVSNATFNKHIQGIKSVDINGHLIEVKPYSYKERAATPVKTKRIKVENAVSETRFYNRAGKKYLVDGKEMTGIQIAELADISISSFQKLSAKMKSITINGVNIVAEPKHLIVCRTFTAIKDNVVHKGLTGYEANNLTTIAFSRIYKIADTGYYTRNGWRFYSE